MFPKNLYLLSLSATLLTSCATIMSGSRQTIGIASNPTNAAVWVDEKYIGQTPIIVDMSRKNNHIVRLELQGYQPYEVIFTRKMNEWVFGNVVFGGLIGLVVDAVSGGIYKLTPEQIQAEMRGQNIAYSKRSKDSYIAIVLKPNPEWKKIGNLCPDCEL